jgi:hypothetical protein
MHDRSVRSIFLQSGNRRKVATFDLCGGGGRPDRSVRSAGPIDFENDRSDPPVSSERPREIPTGKLEQKRPPRPIPAIVRSDRFFCGATNWGWGATGFFGGRGDRSRCRAGFRIMLMRGLTAAALYLIKLPCFWGKTMLYAQNASSGFALRTYPDPESRSRSLPSVGPTRRPSDSEPKRGGGEIITYIPRLF